MFVKQISVFLENKPGKLAEIISLLAGKKIDIQALLIAEAPDYGIMRAIVDRTDEAAQLLRDETIPFHITEVLALSVADEPGSLEKLLRVLADGGISVKYSYAFYSRESGKANIVLRVDDNDAAVELLKRAGIE